jgi:energy-converting hydrogenase Eha subunit E
VFSSGAGIFFVGYFIFEVPSNLALEKFGASRVWHVALGLFGTAIGLGSSGLVTDPVVTMLALIVAAIGIFCTFGVFWTLPTAWLSGTAVAVALIN